MLQVTLEISKSNLLILQVRNLEFAEQSDPLQSPTHFVAELLQEFSLLVLEDLSPWSPHRMTP